MDKVIQGNCLDVLPTLDDNLVDAIVTDLTKYVEGDTI